MAKFRAVRFLLTARLMVFTVQGMSSSVGCLIGTGVYSRPLFERRGEIGVSLVLFNNAAASKNVTREKCQEGQGG